jgi:hypothetical protein
MQRRALTHRTWRERHLTFVDRICSIKSSTATVRDMAKSTKLNTFRIPRTKPKTSKSGKRRIRLDRKGNIENETPAQQMEGLSLDSSLNLGSLGFKMAQERNMDLYKIMEKSSLSSAKEVKDGPERQRLKKSAQKFCRVKGSERLKLNSLLKYRKSVMWDRVKKGDFECNYFQHK